MHKQRYFIGLDLAPAGDTTALAVLERPQVRSRMDAPVYSLRHLHRFQIGTPYPEIVTAVRSLLQTPALRGSLVVVDKTAVGRPILRLLQDGLKGRVTCRFIAVTVVGTYGVAGVVDGRLYVPKQELVATLQVLLQTRRLLISRQLPESVDLVRELEAYRTRPVKLTGNIDELWREGPQDDLVLAAALAGWVGERAMPEVVGVPYFVN